MKHLHLKKRAAPREIFRSRDSIPNYFPENQISEYPISETKTFNKMLENYQNKSQFKAIKEEPEGIYQNPKSRNRDGPLSRLISISSNLVQSKHHKDSNFDDIKQTESQISKPQNSKKKTLSTANIREECIFQESRGTHYKKHYLPNDNPGNPEIQRVRSSQLLKNANNKSNQFINQRLNLTADSKETQKMFHRNYMNKDKRKEKWCNNDKVLQPQNLMNLQAMEQSKRSDQTNDSYFDYRRNNLRQIRMKRGFSQSRLSQISPRRPSLFHQNEVYNLVRKNRNKIREFQSETQNKNFNFNQMFNINTAKNTAQNIVRNTVQNTVQNTVRNTARNTAQNTVQNTDQNPFKNSLSKDKSLDTSIRFDQKKEYTFSFSKQDKSNIFSGLKSPKSMKDQNESNTKLADPIKEESREILSKFAPNQPSSQRSVTQSTHPKRVVKSYNSFEPNLSRNLRKEDNDSKCLYESK